MGRVSENLGKRRGNQRRTYLLAAARVAAQEARLAWQGEGEGRARGGGW